MCTIRWRWAVHGQKSRDLNAPPKSHTASEIALTASGLVVQPSSTPPAAVNMNVKSDASQTSQSRRRVRRRRLRAHYSISTLDSGSDDSQPSFPTHHPCSTAS